jgi:hypothetical protein
VFFVRWNHFSLEIAAHPSEFVSGVGAGCRGVWYHQLPASGTTPDTTRDVLETWALRLRQSVPMLCLRTRVVASSVVTPLSRMTKCFETF